MGVVDLVVLFLDRLPRATSKKKVVNFLRKKVHHADKILAMPMSFSVEFFAGLLHDPAIGRGTFRQHLKTFMFASF